MEVLKWLCVCFGWYTGLPPLPMTEDESTFFFILLVFTKNQRLLPGYRAERGALHRHAVPNLTSLCRQENSTRVTLHCCQWAWSWSLVSMGLVLLSGDIQWLEMIAAIVSDANPVPAVIGWRWRAGDNNQDDTIPIKLPLTQVVPWPHCRKGESAECPWAKSQPLTMWPLIICPANLRLHEIPLITQWTLVLMVLCEKVRRHKNPFHYLLENEEAKTAPIFSVYIADMIIR